MTSRPCIPDRVKTEEARGNSERCTNRKPVSVCVLSSLVAEYRQTSADFLTLDHREVAEADSHQAQHVKSAVTKLRHHVQLPRSALRIAPAWPTPHPPAINLWLPNHRGTPPAGHPRTSSAPGEQSQTVHILPRSCIMSGRQCYPVACAVKCSLADQRSSEPWNTSSADCGACFTSHVSRDLSLTPECHTGAPRPNCAHSGDFKPRFAVA